MSLTRIILASFLGALLSLSAQAVVIPSSQLLGTVVPSTPADPANETEMVRFLVVTLNANPLAPTYPNAGMNLGDNPADPQGETYTLWRPSGLALPAPLPSGTGTQVVTNNTTFNTGAFQYDYVIAKFGPDAAAFYIGNLSGALTIPNLVNTQGLSGYTLINQRDGEIPGVPDGGATAALLGLSMIGLFIGARRFKS